LHQIENELYDIWHTSESLERLGVRKTDVGGRHHFVISVVDSGKVKHFIIKRTTKKRLLWVYDFAFKRVSDLVQYHLRNKVPLCEEGVFIEKPCQKQEWQLNPEQIEPQVKIGEGAFGEDGMWGARIPVAIKTLHSTNMTTDDRIQFLQEANIMREFRHENVIRLHGVCTSKEPIMIVMELAAGGSLLSKLKNLQKPGSRGDGGLNCLEPVGANCLKTVGARGVVPEATMSF
uniref:non-specific protein-tyrosine kinase n=1 Tax=Heligmosomoides polygyrus TaxID=6339 RepID=A0A183G0F1_HELPZ